MYTDKTLTLRKSICERASLENFLTFLHSKTAISSIFCWYFRYFVGTNDMLVGLHVATNFEMYRQNSEKAWLAMPRKPIYDLAGNLRAKRATNIKISVVCLVVFLCWIKRFVLLSLCLYCKYMNSYFSSFQKSRGGRSPQKNLRGDPPPPPHPGSPPMHACDFWSCAILKQNKLGWESKFKEFGQNLRKFGSSKKEFRVQAS